MGFESLDRILKTLSYNAPSGEQQQIDRAIALWPHLVGEAIARYTRPAKLVRGVLHVATASPVWAQQLRFQRPQLIAQLNARLPSPESGRPTPAVRDLRFSPALWHRRDPAPDPAPTFNLSDHPSWWGRDRRPDAHPNSDPRESPRTPRAALDRFERVLSERQQGLPLCPRCGCRTPDKELDRWSVCALCHATPDDTGDASSRFSSDG